MGYENGSKPTKKYFFFYKDSPLPFDFQSLIIAQTGKFRKYVRFLSLIRSHRVEKIPKKNNRTCAIIRDSIVHCRLSPLPPREREFFQVVWLVWEDYQDFTVNAGKKWYNLEKGNKISF